jgi:hypothetical protein
MKSQFKRLLMNLLPRYDVALEFQQFGLADDRIGRHGLSNLRFSVRPLDVLEWNENAIQCSTCARAFLFQLVLNSLSAGPSSTPTFQLVVPFRVISPEAPGSSHNVRQMRSDPIQSISDHIPGALQFTLWCLGQQELAGQTRIGQKAGHNNNQCFSCFSLV